jgi:hypothetical protein
LVAAFLVSSFGHLQFELHGYNREGCLSVELHHLEQIRVVDPRSMTEDERQGVLEAFEALPYPVPATSLSCELAERNALDDRIAEVLCRLNGGWSPDELVAEVHALLDDYLIARKP